MTQAIFLSYASQDADAARRICDALRAAGLEVWFDQSELRGGDSWDASIRKQIKECALFVPMISASTNARSEGYFRLEWKLAVDRSHLMADDQAFFLPVVLDDSPESTARVPDKFRERQWTRLQDDNASTAFATRVSKLLSGSGVSAINAPNAAPILVKPALHAGSTPDADEGFWVAVLPFKYRGGNADIAALAEGMSEEIVTGLSRFSYLRVIARGATLQLPSEVSDVRLIGKELGARYVMEGNLRQAGALLRVSAQLVDASTGAHLWAETYDRPFKPEDVFALQDDLVPRIVSTVADIYGVLCHSMSEIVRNRPVDQLSPYEALLRSMGYFERVTPEAHADARACLERAVQQAPNNGACWAVLSGLYNNEHGFGMNVLPNSLDRAYAAAQRAVGAAPANNCAYQQLAWASFYRKEFEAARIAAERALKLNPMDGAVIANLGMILAFSGEWDRGCALIERGSEYNPNLPSWQWMASTFNAYRKRDYRTALEAAAKSNVPGFILMRILIAASYGQLGNREAGSKAILKLHADKAGFIALANEWLEKWFDAEMIGHLFEGLRKSGLETPDANATVTLTPVLSTRPAIAVLPFTNMSINPDDEYFADGITEEIINALAQIDGLRVAARTSCFAFKGKNEDLRVVAEKLGVSSVLEGSVRKAGSKLRITAQLINAADGCHLWSERYDRELIDVFAMQDEIAAAIATRLQVSMAGQLPNPPRPAIKNTGAYELLMKGRVLLNRRGRALLESRVCLERAVALEPDNAEALAQLANCYRLHSLYGIAPSNEMMPRARALAERALTLDPLLIEALTSLANIVGTYDWDPAASFALSEQVRSGDPLNIRALCEPAYWLSLLDTEPSRMNRALADLRTARNLDPLNAWVAAMHAASLRFAGKFTEAIAAARHALELDAENFLAHWSVVISLAALARFDEAIIAADAALDMSGRHPWILAELAGVHAARGADGDRDSAEAVYQELRVRAQTSYIGFAEQSAAAASAGHLAEARALVQKAVDAREVYVLYWKLSAWAPLRADAEGLRILRSTGL